MTDVSLPVLCASTSDDALEGSFPKQDEQVRKLQQLTTPKDAYMHVAVLPALGPLGTCKLMQISFESCLFI